MPNTTPERIELRDGWYADNRGEGFHIGNPAISDESIWHVRTTHTKSEFLQFLAALNPAPSESDEAVAQEIIEACIDDNELGEDRFKLDVKTIAAILARRQPAAADAAIKKIDDVLGAK